MLRFGGMKPEARAALTAMEVALVNLIPNDNAQEWLHKVKFANKIDALKILAQHHRLAEPAKGAIGTSTSRI